MKDISLPPLPVASLLRQYQLRPSKGLGQSFLQDNHALQRILQAAEIQPEDEVLEIGAGLGHLTRYLALQARRVVAVELDERLFPILQTVLAPYRNVELIHGDILALAPGDLMHTPNYLVVANIPYYITSALIRHLLEAECRPRRLVLTVQREVAERLCAAPGAMNLLALSVQVYGKPAIVAHLAPGVFYPPPKVSSAVVRIEVYPRPLIPPEKIPRFFELVRAGFSQKRKTLRNALAAGLALPIQEAARRLQGAGLDPNRRAETLSLSEWEDLLNAEDSPRLESLT